MSVIWQKEKSIEEAYMNRNIQNKVRNSALNLQKNCFLRDEIVVLKLALGKQFRTVLIGSLGSVIISLTFVKNKWYSGL